MAVRRSSSVAAEARAAARERRMSVQAARRQREQRIEELADEHAVAVAMAQEIRARAERDIADQMAKADKAIVELLDLDERADDVAQLLGLKVAEVRAARRRARSGASGGDAAADDADPSPAGDDADVVDDDADVIGPAEAAAPVRGAAAPAEQAAA